MDASLDPPTGPEPLPVPHQGVLREIAAMWAFARAEGFAEELRALHAPGLARSLRAIGIDWSLIAVAAVLAIRLGGPFVVVALLVIGNRQRALGNLLHDASHRGLDADRGRAERIADWLLCRPLWVSMRLYRSEHNRHHRHLGDPARDPDYIHDASRLRHGWFAVWRDQILSPGMFRVALFSHLGRMNARELAGVAAWWVMATAVVAGIGGAGAAAGFLALWVAARALVFHPITAFREISDHVGLVPGTLIGFSRNHPFGGVLGQVFHPHHNGYHLLHHLDPALPFHALPRAHALLMRWPPYAQAEQCTGYFSGSLSVARSWVRRWA